MTQSKPVIIDHHPGRSSPETHKQWEERIAIAAKDGMPALLESTMQRWFPPETLKANPAAVNSVDEYKKTIETFSATNPFVKEGHPLRYVGMTSFGQKRQIAVPMVVTEFKDGKFETLFVGSVD